MANANGWGDGAVNNVIGWGDGAATNLINWGWIHYNSYSGATDIKGISPNPPNPNYAPENYDPPYLDVNLPNCVGFVLTFSDDYWIGQPYPTFTYQWHRVDRNGYDSPIRYATNSYYLIEVEDLYCELYVVVTAENIMGRAEAHSNAILVTT